MQQQHKGTQLRLYKLHSAAAEDQRTVQPLLPICARALGMPKSCACTLSRLEPAQVAAPACDGRSNSTLIARSREANLKGDVKKTVYSWQGMTLLGPHTQSLANIYGATAHFQ